VQATNPFVLWLLCKYILRTEKWPKSRVELLDHYNRTNYEESMSTGLPLQERQQAMESAFLAWGRIALEITNRNMGTEFPLLEVDTVLGPDESLRLQEGLRCGVLWQDRAATVIRFRHHRFQEFFTAYYLLNSKEVSLPWLDKLDSPRWQETMFNLVLMGGGNEGLLALSESFHQDVSKLSRLDESTHKAPKSNGPEPVPQDSDEEEKHASITHIETLLADRVELASRILQQTQHQPNEIRSTLLSAFTRAVYWLSDHGNPITQVKLLLASRVVPEIDLWEVADKAIDLKVNWVSQQAHIIALAANRDRKVSTHGESNTLQRLLSDLWLNFASGQFLNRLGYYLGIATSGKAQLRMVLVFGLTIYLATFAIGYGLVVTAQQLVLPAFSRTETWAQSSVQKGTNFWERQLVETVKVESAKKKRTASETEADLETAVKWPRWFRSYFEASRPKFEVAIASSRQTLSSWWFFGVVHAVMFFSLVYSLKTSPGYTALVFQISGYLCLLSTITLWTVWLGGFVNIVLLTYFLFLFVAILSSIAWVTMCVVELVGLGLFSVITLFLTRQPLTRETLRTMPLQSFWDSGFRNSGKEIIAVLKIAFWPFLLIPISIGAEVDWPRTAQRAEQFLVRLPSIPLGIKISLNVLVFTLICVVVSRQTPRVRSWFEQRRQKVNTTSAGDAVAGCLMLILLGIACSALSALGTVPKSKWQFFAEYALRNFGLFPSIPTWVNISYSVIAYAIVAGCFVTLIVILVNRLRDIKGVLKGLAGWTSFCLMAALVVLTLWGVSRIDLSLIGSYIGATIVSTFNLFPYFPPLVNGLLSFAFYLEVIGCLVALGLSLRRKDEGLERPLRLLKNWTIVCFGVALVPFVLWGIVWLLAMLGLSIYSAAVTGRLGPIVVVVLAIACVVTFFVLLSQLLKDTPFDVPYVLRRPADPIDEWKQFQDLSPKKQAMLIVRTLDLHRSDEDFLSLLRRVEKNVAEEPASSVYWETRGKMEAIALQKRMG